MTGRNSLVLCKTPTFKPSPAKEFDVKVGVSQLGQDLKVVEGVSTTVKFKAGAPALYAPEGMSKFNFPKVVQGNTQGLTKDSFLMMEFDVYDPDFDDKNVKGNLRDGSVVVSNSANKLYPQTGTIKYVGGGDNGLFRVRMMLKVAVPRGKILKETATLTITLADSVGKSVTNVPIIMDVRPPNLLMKLCTTAGGNARIFGNTDWWSSDKVFFPEKAGDGDWQQFRDDIKTEAFSMPIGPILNVLHLKGAAIVATSSYDIKPQFQAKSLKELVNLNVYTNARIGSKNAGRSSGKILGKYNDAGRDGNCNPRAGDGFADHDWDLKVRPRNQYGSQDHWDRLGFHYEGCKGGHMYGGIGGTHYHNGWTIAYEAMPVVGYCNVWNGYGTDGSNSAYPRGGANPYRNCGGSRRRDPIDMAIYRIDP